MLLSMTGFGEAHKQDNGLAVVVEVRAINNRYFKFTMRSGDGYSAPGIARGIAGARSGKARHHSSQRAGATERFAGRFFDQPRRAGRLPPAIAKAAEPGRPQGRSAAPKFFDVAGGVVKERLSDPTTVEADWPVIERTLKAALDQPGKKCAATKAPAMANDLTAKLPNHLHGAETN